jgi:Rrf2 family transcriptional regulator, iron-sulfur cluster assembly transcription factor
MLKLSKKMLYAIEAVLDIAYHAGSTPVQSQEITRRQGIPKRYLEQALQVLVRNDVLRGVRGPRGGYRLARERRRITVADIVRVVHSMETDERKKTDDSESELGARVVKPLLDQLQGDMMTQLEAISIDDLCDQALKADVVSEGRSNLDFTI